MNNKLTILKILSGRKEPMPFDELCDLLGVKSALACGNLWSEMLYMENNGFIVIMSDKRLAITFEGLDFLRREKSSNITFGVTVASAIFGLIAAVAAIIALP